MKEQKTDDPFQLIKNIMAHLHILPSSPIDIMNGP